MVLLNCLHMNHLSRKKAIALTIAVEEVMTGNLHDSVSKVTGRFLVSEPPQKMLSRKRWMPCMPSPSAETTPIMRQSAAFQMIEHSITAHRGCYGVVVSGNCFSSRSHD